MIVICAFWKEIIYFVIWIAYFMVKLKKDKIWIYESKSQQGLVYTQQICINHELKPLLTINKPHDIIVKNCSLQTFWIFLIFY